MGKTKIHIEKAKYDLGDDMSEKLRGHFNRHNYRKGESKLRRTKIRIKDLEDLDDML